MNENTGNSYVNLHGYVYGVYFSDFVRERGLKMGMSIEELIIFCEEEEYNHRLTCKRYDDASGYTRSKDKNIRIACAIREEAHADFYRKIAETMRKYQKIQKIVSNSKDTDGDIKYNWLYEQIGEVVKDGNDD